MTMLSFRADEDLAEQVQTWAERLGVDRSQLLRDALHRHLLRLESEDDEQIWVDKPLDAGERLLSQVADWGPAEDWSDWVDAAR